MEVIELRNYLLRDGAAGDFRRYFEEHFLFSQREEGMFALGQFEPLDDPHRFVWIRGFATLEARVRSLSAFYGGPFWQAHRDAANAMMLEFHNVHLLRPLSPVSVLTRGRSLEDRAAEPAGAVPPDSGLVVADFFRSLPGGLNRLVDSFEQRLQPALVAAGHQLLGHFVAELTPNGYPRLPVIQDPCLLVVLAAYRDREQAAALRNGAFAALRGEMRRLLAGEVESLRLRPTARSLIRYHGEETR